jgi:hypothetical protein
MKIKFIIAAIFAVASPILPIQAKEPAGKQDFGPLKELILTYMSEISYEDAMQKFYKRKPEGYVMDSMMPYRSGSKYIIKVKLRKI